MNCKYINITTGNIITQTKVCNPTTITIGSELSIYVGKSYTYKLNVRVISIVLNLGTDNIISIFVIPI